MNKAFPLCLEEFFQGESQRIPESIKNQFVEDKQGLGVRISVYLSDDVQNPKIGHFAQLNTVNTYVN